VRRLRFGIDPPRLTLRAEEFAGSVDSQTVEFLAKQHLEVPSIDGEQHAGAGDGSEIAIDFGAVLDAVDADEGLRVIDPV